MARLSQLSPNNYKSSSQISTEFESVIRYVNAAELGNRTIGELLAQIFDANGTWAGPLEMRLDATLGLTYRVGTYTNPSEGWQTIAALSDLRGAAGTNVGQIELAPLLPPVEITATNNQTDFEVAADGLDGFIVFRNGLLQREGALADYTVTRVSGFDTQTIVMNSPQAAGVRISIVRVRTDLSILYARTEHVTTGPQSVFSFDPILEAADIFVYRNGIFQREGGSYDYTRQTNQPTITFNSSIPADDTVSIFGFAPTGENPVPGIMLERDFVDPVTGKIPYSSLGLTDNAVPATKVDGLATLVTEAARLHIGATAPVNPTVVRFWLDTSAAPNSLKVWDGSVWLRTSVENILPIFSSANANQVLQVNALGTNLEFSAVDLSSVIPRTWIGAASGVAALDVDGRLPTSQLPANFPADSIYFLQDGSVTDVEYTMKRIYGQRIRITGIAARLSGGTANIQLSIGGTAQGPVVGVSSSPVEQILATPIEVDASTALRTLGVTVTSASSAANLEVSLSVRAII